MILKELYKQLDEHLGAVDDLRPLVSEVVVLAESICDRFAQGGTVFTFGNGGSAADAQHLAAELVGRYLRDRSPLPAVALSTDPSITTCIANDYSYDIVFARQVAALVERRDVVIAFSTSGTSKSVVEGLRAARSREALTVLFTGRAGTAAAIHADYVMRVPASATARIQEGHLVLLHLLSEAIDQWAFAQDCRGS